MERAEKHAGRTERLTAVSNRLREAAAQVPRAACLDHHAHIHRVLCKVNQAQPTFGCFQSSTLCSQRWSAAALPGIRAPCVPSLTSASASPACPSADPSLQSTKITHRPACLGAQQLWQEALQRSASAWAPPLTLMHLRTSACILMTDNHSLRLPISLSQALQSRRLDYTAHSCVANSRAY